MKYIVRILVWGLLALQLSVLVLLNIPSVQEKLASTVSIELKKLLNTEVSIGQIKVGLFNRLHIEDVQLDDLNGEDMLNVRRLSARFELMPLLKGKIVINSVQLIGFDIQLRKETPEAIPNFQFVLDAFASKDTLKEPMNLDLRINSVLINRGRLSFDVLSEPETPGKFNTSHLGVQDLSANISLKALRNDTVHAMIRRFAFTEKSGMRVNKLGMKLLANNNHLDLSHLQLQLENSTLTMDSLAFRYDSLKHLTRMTDDVSFQGHLKGNVVLKDLSPIVPVLKNVTRFLDQGMPFPNQENELHS